MKRLGVLKPDSIVSLVNWLTIPLVVVYLISMFLVPAIVGGLSWTYLEAVWDRWQALNVGMLALVSSVTAFNIARYNANRQSARNFRAAKAFLPDALSELCDYFERSAEMLRRVWDLDSAQPMEVAPPELPSGYRAVFQECIRYADPAIGDYLARILVWLQVHDARLKRFAKERSDPSYVKLTKLNVLDYLVRLGELKALVDGLFEFSRSLGEFNDSPLRWEDFNQAYRLLGIEADRFTVGEALTLEAHTRRHIDRRGRG